MPPTKSVLSNIYLHYREKSTYHMPQSTLASHLTVYCTGNLNQLRRPVIYRSRPTSQHSALSQPAIKVISLQTIYVRRPCTFLLALWKVIYSSTCKLTWFYLGFVTSSIKPTYPFIILTVISASFVIPSLTFVIAIASLLTSLHPVSLTSSIIQAVCSNKYLHLDAVAVTG